MKKSLLILSILFLLNACSFENSKDTGKVGEKSAEISAKDTLGKAVKLADDNTSLKVLVFFSKWLPFLLKRTPFFR